MARLNVGSGLRLARTRYGGDRRRIDLDAPVINWHIDIHVGPAHVADNRGSSLPANASAGTLKRERTRCEDAGGGASRPVIPERVKTTRHRQVRGASGSGKRRRRSRRTRNWALGMTTASWVGKAVRALAECGPDCESSSARDVRDRSARVCLARAFVARSGSDALPTPEGNFRLATRTASRRR